MLTQTIIKYHPPANEHKEKPRFRAGSDEHLNHIFTNHLVAALNNGELQPGKSVRIKQRKGAHSRGVVIHVEENIELIDWAGFMCKFIEVWIPVEENTSMFHPSELEAA